jgi:xylulokinase
MMAATGAGAEIATMPPIARTIDPDHKLTAAFNAGHARYRAAAAAIQKLSH